MAEQTQQQPRPPARDTADVTTPTPALTENRQPGFAGAPSGDPAVNEAVAEGTDESETMWVESNRNDARVAFYQRHMAHPGGEAYVSNSAPARDGDPVVRTPSEVAKTSEAMIALHERRIKQVKAPARKAAPAAGDEDKAS